MYDIAIIGAGAAGIEAARHARAYKLTTVLIDESQDAFGGTCLNKGCIPAKWYLTASKHQKDILSIFEKKNRIVAAIKSAACDSLKREGIEVVFSQAAVTSPTTVSTSGTSIEAKNIIVATGSSPQAVIPPDGRKVLFAEDIYSLDSLGKRFCIVGAGYIGLETATLLRNLDKEVLVIEKEDTVLPSFDQAVVRRLLTLLKKKGISISLSDDISRYDVNDFDTVLLATGRKPNTEGLFAKTVPVALDERGFIACDAQQRSSVKTIFAVGDVTGKKLLAYVAEAQARLCIDTIAGKDTCEDHRGLAQCIFTQPQFASVGITEDEAKQKNLHYSVVKSNFLASAASWIYQDTDGYIKIIIGEGGQILGASLLSEQAVELINLFTLAMRNNVPAQELGTISPVHPSMCEIIASIIRHS